MKIVEGKDLKDVLRAIRGVWLSDKQLEKLGMHNIILGERIEEIQACLKYNIMDALVGLFGEPKIYYPHDKGKLRNYKLLEKLDNGAIIELERFGVFDFVYFASNGIYIGLQKHENKETGLTGDMVLHTIPFHNDNIKKIKIKLSIIEIEEK